jgi:hypothetical protein
MEKRDIFFFGGGGSVVVLVAVGPFWVAGVLAIGPAPAGNWAFFFFRGAFFLATERGLNMRGLPTSFTSSSGFWPSGMDGPAVLELGGGRIMPDVGPASPSSKASPPLMKAGSAPVRKCTPGAGVEPSCLELPAAAGAAAPVLFGGGRKEPRPLNRLPPAVLVRFAGGCSFSASASVVELAAERLTTILPAPEERSRSFWKAFFGAADVVADVGFDRTVSVSDSESEYSTRPMAALLSFGL